jgi:hypothetical protein
MNSALAAIICLASFAEKAVTKELCERREASGGHSGGISNNHTIVDYPTIMGLV